VSQGFYRRYGFVVQEKAFFGRDFRDFVLIFRLNFHYVFSYHCDCSLNISVIEGLRYYALLNRFINFLWARL